MPSGSPTSTAMATTRGSPASAALAPASWPTTTTAGTGPGLFSTLQPPPRTSAAATSMQTARPTSLRSEAGRTTSSGSVSAAPAVVVDRDALLSPGHRASSQPLDDQLGEGDRFGPDDIGRTD